MSSPCLTHLPRPSWAQALCHDLESNREMQWPVKSRVWLGCSCSLKEFAQCLRYCCCSDFTLPVCFYLCNPQCFTPSKSCSCEPGSLRRGKCCLWTRHPAWISTWSVSSLTFRLGQSKASGQIWEKAKSDGDILARQ